MRQVKIGPQGIRGRVDDGLELEQLIDVVSAFATWLEGGPVLVARDTRPSSPMLGCAVRAALSACGCEVFDAGICPTAVAQFEAQARDLAGVISITGAHNDARWNGLKLFGGGGAVLSSAEGREVLDLWHQDDYLRARTERLGTIHQLGDPFSRYLEALGQWVDVEAIAAAKLRVVVDACNGAGSLLVKDVCHRLGVSLIPISCELGQRFPHTPDPTASNLAHVAAIMEPVEADFGFGFSSDCERVGAVTAEGKPLGRRATLPLTVEHLLERGEGAVGRKVLAGVTCDSRVYRIAERHGAQVVRCGVGVQAVVERMAIEEGLVGGDDSGGVAITDVQLAYDGVAVLALLLEAIAQRGSPQALTDTLPQIFARAATVPCRISSAYSAVARIRERLDPARVEDLDGVRVELDDGWYHVRVSHTEPVIRVTCEASTADLADELLALVSQQVRAATQG
jgi:phosphomannomutase